MKSRIKETKYPKSDAKGNSCLVVLEDKTDGFYNYKGDFPFAVGEEVEYTATRVEKKTKPGEFYNTLKLEKAFAPTGGQTPVLQPTAPTKVNVPPTSGIREAKSLAEMKFEARICNMKLAVSCLEAGKFERKDVLEAFAEWNSVFDAAIDELKPR